jgi:hypothetical protein
MIKSLFLYHGLLDDTAYAAGMVDLFVNWKECK